VVVVTMGITEVAAVASPAVEEGAEGAEVVAEGVDVVGAAEVVEEEGAAAAEEVAVERTVEKTTRESAYAKLAHSARLVVPFSDPDPAVSL
jgi:hypothetical protein